MKKIGILNDIHGNAFLMNLAIEEMKKKNVDSFLIGGDYISDGPDSIDIIKIIKSYPMS